jgi:hypothetical protein
MEKASQRGVNIVHTHFSFMSALQVFLCVLVVGTLWRLACLHLMASSNPTLQHVGKAGGFQY